MNEFEQENANIPPLPEFQPMEQPKKEKKQKKHTTKLVVLALLFSLAGSIAGAGISMLFQKRIEQQAKQSITQIQAAERDEVVLETVETGELMTSAQVYAQNVNSTVGITTSITTNYWGFQTTSAASGSGFIITEDGYILTNYHVIQGSSGITVSLYDGSTYPAELIGYDASNDIAVIKVEAENLTPVIIGDHNKMYVGDTVVAIGNPLGELTFSLTQGVISAKDRTVTLSTGSTMKLLQTDCSINSGNSGGALFNLYGEVVGITNAKYSNNGSSSEASIENIGFAIPIGDVMPIVESIIENGYVAKPYIGISVTNVSEETQSYGLPQGAAVVEVTEGSPAQEGGLQKNDIITALNGEEITGSQDLIDKVGSCQIGDTLTLTVYRKGETVTITIVVGQQVQSALEETQTQTQNQPQFPSFP